MLPNVTFDYDSRIFTFTLWRNEKQVIHELKGANVFVDVMPLLFKAMPIPLTSTSWSS